MTLLRDIPGQRRVFRHEHEGRACVTRVILEDRVPAQRAELIRSLVLDGGASLVGVSEKVAPTIEGYRVAALHLERDDPEWTNAVDAGVNTDGHCFITTRWMEGIPLSDDAVMALPETERRALVLHVLAVLSRLHARLVAYGDLKPQNLVRTGEGRVCLIDLDTLRRVPAPTTGAIAIDLTPHWAAPEQKHRTEIWLASDLWAWEKLVGHLLPEGAPDAWAGGLAACRRRDPARRPSTASLLAHCTGGGELVACDGTTIHGRSPDGDADEDADPIVPAGQTERVETRRTDAHRGQPRGTETERVDDARRAPAGGRSGPRSGGSMAETTGSAVSAVARNVLKDRPGCLGWLSGMTSGALIAVAAAGIVGVGAWSWWSMRVREDAERRAETTLDALKVHKTDPAHNGKGERERLASDATAAWEEARTPRTCAIYALASVWQQGWHFTGAWDPARFASGESIVNDVHCRDEAEALLARGTLFAGACIRRFGGDTPSPEHCATAITALTAFQARLPDGDAHNWLRVEGAWQEVRARRALAGRYLQTGNAEATSMLADAMARCTTANADWLSYAPVNGPEMMEDCLGIAGLAEDPTHYLLFADAFTASGLPTERKERAKKVSHLYNEAGLHCGDVALKWKSNGWSATGPAWCMALGHAARHCGGAATSVINQLAPTDPGHPWDALYASVVGAAWPESACIQ